MDKNIMDQVLEGKTLISILSEAEDADDEEFEIDKEFVKKVEDIAEEVGFDVTGSTDGDDWTFSIYSPEGQDFNIVVSAKDKDELIHELYSYVDNFDISYETYLWLGSDGHGQNGAPDDMRDCYNDMEWCYEKAKELEEVLRNDL